ncbi:type II secretion system GspH family protein [Myxococcota bacterium]|nr:type II secretion system GspH family protein [Myxococcota bacterium]MBU1537112.1 type II secretion system GspH family protein [Myxococcota bacterium]
MTHRGPGLYQRSGGFTLLEVVVSLAILSMALMWILIDQTIAVKRSVRVRMLTQAIYLAKSKMLETEGTLRHDGFGSFEEENCGDFDNSLYEGSENFRFCVQIEKVVMPDMSMLQQNIMGALGMSSGTQNPDSGATPGPLGGLMEQFLPSGLMGSGELSEKFNEMAGQFLGPAMTMIQGVLEEAIRKITVKVFFKVGGTEKEYELVAYITDLGELDRSLMIPSMGGTTGSSTGNSKTSGKSTGNTKTTGGTK